MSSSATSCWANGGSAVAKKFNLAELVPEMGAVSNSDTAPKITMIPIEELRPNGGNFYDTSNFEDLADSIELNGLLEPLCVFRRGQGTGSYVIFSGHRRYKALHALYQKDRTRWAEVPCIVYPDPHDANREMVMLIHANSTGRVLSNWEKAEQALRLKKALVAMREGGAELPGRIRDLVAEEMQMSASKLARLEAIGNRLTYRSWLELWKAGKLNESVAYRLSMLEWEEQERVWLWLSENRPGLSAEKIALKDVEAAINPEPEEDEKAAVSKLDTNGETIPQPPAAAAPFAQGSLKWRRCLVDEPEEGQLVLVVDPDIASMPDVCAYLGGQYVDGLGRGDAMEVKSFWLWLPLPPFPWEVSEE